MLINGTGITEVNFKVLPDFQVLTKLALSWKQLSSGAWVATDRGADTDVYDCRISTYGLETVINNFISQIYAGRIGGGNLLTLSSFADTEHIFGENVDHSGSIEAFILEMPKRGQGSSRGWGISDIHLRATTVTFTGATTMPTIAYCEPGGESDRDCTIMTIDSYNRQPAFSDHRADSGIFEGVFTFTNADFIKMRNYIRITRSGNFTLSDTFGVALPFGPLSGFTYPGAVKLVEWEDLGAYGLKYRKMRLRFAEAV